LCHSNTIAEKEYRIIAVFSSHIQRGHILLKRFTFEEKERKEKNMFAAKTSIRNYVCRRTIHPRDVMSSSSSSVAAAASAGQHARYLSKNMSSSPMMMEASAEEESHFALILGKPGGGKGTISGKILKVRFDTRSSAQ
jgi:hypothetical protein